MQRWLSAEKRKKPSQKWVTILLTISFFLYFSQESHQIDGRDRTRILNGSSRSLASTHPMLATATSGGLGVGGQYGDQSPGPMHHFATTADGMSLSSKVHTVILTGKDKMIYLFLSKSHKIVV